MSRTGLYKALVSTNTNVATRLKRLEIKTTKPTSVNGDVVKDDKDEF